MILDIFKTRAMKHSSMPEKKGAMRKFLSLHEGHPDMLSLRNREKIEKSNVYGSYNC